MYYKYLRTDQVPRLSGVLVILHDKVSFETSTKCVDYAGVLIILLSDAQAE